MRNIIFETGRFSYFVLLGCILHSLIDIFYFTYTFRYRQTDMLQLFHYIANVIDASIIISPVSLLPLLVIVIEALQRLRITYVSVHNSFFVVRNLNCFG